MAKLTRKTKPDAEKWGLSLNQEMIETVDDKLMRFTLTERVAEAETSGHSRLEVYATSKGRLLLYDRVSEEMEGFRSKALLLKELSERLDRLVVRKLFSELGGKVSEHIPEL